MDGVLYAFVHGDEGIQDANTVRRTLRKGIVAFRDQVNPVMEVTG